MVTVLATRELEEGVERSGRHGARGAGVKLGRGVDGGDVFRTATAHRGGRLEPERRSKHLERGLDHAFASERVAEPARQLVKEREVAGLRRGGCAVRSRLQHRANLQRERPDREHGALVQLAAGQAEHAALAAGGERRRDERAVRAVGEQRAAGARLGKHGRNVALERRAVAQDGRCQPRQPERPTPNVGRQRQRRAFQEETVVVVRLDQQRAADLAGREDAGEPIERFVAPAGILKRCGQGEQRIRKRHSGLTQGAAGNHGGASSLPFERNANPIMPEADPVSIGASWNIAIRRSKLSLKVR